MAVQSTRWDAARLIASSSSSSTPSSSSSSTTPATLVSYIQSLPLVLLNRQSTVGSVLQFTQHATSMLWRHNLAERCQRGTASTP